jgi:hypothetical protein
MCRSSKDCIAAADGDELLQRSPSQDFLSVNDLARSEKCRKKWGYNLRGGMVETAVDGRVARSDPKESVVERELEGWVFKVERSRQGRHLI